MRLSTFSALRRDLEQYIAAYIQGLYTVYNGAGVQGCVAVLVWPLTRGVGSFYSSFVKQRADQTYNKLA